MKTTHKHIEKTIEHPLESHFNIEPNTTIATRTERETELIEMNSYDDKDVEIEETYQEIHDKAMDGHDRLVDEIENLTESKYVARLSEVANTFLNTALSAAQSKAKLKEHKDKQSTKRQTGSGPKTVNNNIVISREEFLEQILKGGTPLPPPNSPRPEDTIEIEHIQETGKKDE